MRRKQIEAILANDTSKPTLYNLANELLGPRGQRTKYWKKKQLKEIHKQEHQMRLLKKKEMA